MAFDGADASRPEPAPGVGDASPPESRFQEAVERADELLDRARSGERVTDCDAAIEQARTALEAVPDGDGRRAGPHYQLAVGYGIRNEHTGSVEDLREALEHVRALHGNVAAETPLRQEISVLTATLTGRYLQLGEAGPEEIEQALGDLARAAEIAGGDVPLPVRYALGLAHAVRFFGFQGDSADRDSATAWLSELIEQPDVDVVTADSCRLVVATLLLGGSAPVELRGRHSGFDQVTSADLGLQAAPEEVATAQRHLAAISTPFTDSAITGQLSAMRLLASAGAGQLDPTAAEGELAEVGTALDDVPNEAIDPNERTGMRTLVQAIRAHMSGDAEGIGEPIADAMTALPDGHVLREYSVSVLGAHTREPVESGDLGEIGARSADAVDRLERALERLSSDDPDRANVLTGLVRALFLNMAANRAPGAMARIRELAWEAIERGGTDAENAGLNHALLGLAVSASDDVELSLDDIGTAIEHLRTAERLLPEGHALRDCLQPILGVVLHTRYLHSGEEESLDAALYYSGRGSRNDVPMRCAAAEMRLLHSVQRGDRDGLQQIVQELEGTISELPERHYMRPRATSMLILVRMLRDFRAGHVDPSSLGDSVDSLLDIAGEIPETALDRPLERKIAAMACIVGGVETDDPAMLNRGIGVLRAVADHTTFPHERMHTLGALGVALRNRYESTRTRRDLNNAIDRLEQAHRMLRQTPGGIEPARLVNELAGCYFTRGDPARNDPQRAVRLGLESLRERARSVLLQSSATRALSTAAKAAGEAASVTRWCLAAAKPKDAVAALELGRGMVLHSATVEASVPSMLRAGGHDDLAGRWEREAAEPGVQPWDSAEFAVLSDLAGAPTPSDLRYRVLDAVQGSPAQERLLTTPPVTEIAGALRSTAAQALVYLVPAEGTEPGIAVLITDTGEVREIRCPLLTAADGSTIDRFDRLQRERARADAPDAVEQQWRSALGEVCDWAWTAALNQVLDVVSAGSRRHPSRIVLVPVGKLGSVPWHAARHPVPGGEVRYVFQDAVLRYAASARQFVDTSRREHRPWRSEPALVRVAGSGLLWASEELEDIYHRHYSHGVYLGRRRQGGRRVPAPKPGDVQELLPGATSPGASLLHLGCHAYLAATPVGSALRLGSGSTLQVQDILRQARDRPADTPGGLVVLAACASDLTGREHDEVLTLATAFLTAGAVGVVGARWNVDDLHTALIMIMFHHYLNAGYDDPATALRAAQLWMIDSRRALPDGVGRRLAPELGAIDPGDPANWAAFSYQGK